MILVTGATGQIGHAAARALAAGGAAVRGLVRDPATVSGLPGVELAQGAFEDEIALARAMSGVDVLLLAGRDNPDHVAQHENVLRAAENGGVRHVVKLSAIGASTASPIELLRHHGIVEARLRDGRLPWTVVRPHFFLQNLLRDADAVRTNGRLRSPMGAARVPLVDTRDVGAALAAILTSPGRHVREAYTLTGAEAVRYDQVADALTRLVGRTIAYEPVAPEQYRRELVAAGTPEWRANDLAYIASSYAPSDWAVRPDLPALIGRSGRSLTDFLDDHRDVFTGDA